MKDFTDLIVNKFADIFDEEVEFESFLKVIGDNRG